MSESPCLKCDFKDEDKKTDQCENCEARIKYAVKEGMLPEEVLEQKEDPVIKEAREMVPGRKRGRKPKHKGSNRAQINLHFGEGGEAKQIIDELQKIAKQELRRTTEQALYFIREGIEKWKGEHN